MGKARRLSHHHPDAGSSIAPTAELLNAALIERGPRATAILGVDLGELAPSARETQDALEDIGFDQGTGHHEMVPGTLGTPIGISKSTGRIQW